MDGEIKDNIDVVCNKVAGAMFKAVDREKPFTHCSDWEVTLDAPEDCCGITEYCDPRCDSPKIGSFNRIDFQISLNGTADDTQMTVDICRNALETELRGCPSGSEQNHDAFWW